MYLNGKFQTQVPPLSNNLIQLNTDGAIKEDFGFATIGGVYETSTGVGFLAIIGFWEIVLS